MGIGCADMSPPDPAQIEEVLMGVGRMHPEEVPTDASLVHRLLAAQFPHWSHLPLEPVPSAGTANALYRLGEDLAARLPRIPSAAGQVEKEHRWLPRLAAHLPLPVPVPVGKGVPAEGYPWPWSVQQWIEGEDAVSGGISDPSRAATDLGRFVAALQRIDPTGGAPPGEHNFFRGVPLAARDAPTRAAIDELRQLGAGTPETGDLDISAVIATWEAALRAPAWDGPPLWFHGDLLAGNLLVRQGRLSAVIDFGGLGVGDPACDVMTAWTFLSASTRDAFRAVVQVDDPTWARGHGWALSVGLIALPYYRVSNPVFAKVARRAIDEALADQQRTG